MILVGATTENPFFEVNSALISRSRVVELKALTDEAIGRMLDRALASDKGFGGRYALTPEARDAVIVISGGDGRSALTTLELAAALVDLGTPDAPAAIDVDQVHAANPHRALSYDKNKDMHYDIISVFIKSLRGSDPDAALYWLARMIDGGEDPKFIARRMMIQASEDVGLADPQALLIAEAAFKSAEVIGYPECRINLARSGRLPGACPCEQRLRGRHRRRPGRGAPPARAAMCPPTCAIGIARARELRMNTKVSRDYPGGWVEQRYLPEGLERGCFYHPTERLGGLSTRGDHPCPRVGHRTRPEHHRGESLSAHGHPRDIVCARMRKGGWSWISSTPRCPWSSSSWASL